MAAKIWNADKNKQLIKMCDSKVLSINEMAQKLNVSHPTVYNRAKKLGYADFAKKNRAAIKFEFSAQEKRFIVVCANKGMKVTEIALAGREKFGGTKWTIGPVLRIYKELGLRTSAYKSLKAGQRFGYLEVVREIAPKKLSQGHFHSRCVVRCHCGNEKEVFNFNLRSGNTKTCGCKGHLFNPDTPYIRIFHGYLHGAESRKLEMNLNISQLRHIVHMKCFYCTSEFSNYLKGRSQGRSNNKTKLQYMGIDRVDSASHYRPGNVLPACRMCNRAKSNASLSNFVAWLKRLGSKLSEKEILQGAKKLGRVLEKLA